MTPTAQFTLPRTPVKPFYFNTSAHLLRITTQKANTRAEFLVALRVCPDNSIFQHTVRTRRWLLLLRVLLRDRTV